VAVQRLQKILADAGVASRRKCEEIIAQGRVTVDGVLIREMGVKADPETARIEVDGVQIKQERKVYYLLNKPAGVLSTTADEFGRPTVLGLIPGETRRMYPVGRLDEDTEGLILLTNDGELANILTHPRYGVPKIYSARLRGVITNEAVEQILKGFHLEDGLAKAEKVLVTHRGDTESHVRLLMREGRNHIVRRMMAKAGFPAKLLRRDRIAFLTLHGLGKGESRPLTRLEVERLYRYAEKAKSETLEGFDLPRPRVQRPRGSYPTPRPVERPYGRRPYTPRPAAGARFQGPLPHERRPEERFHGPRPTGGPRPQVPQSGERPSARRFHKFGSAGGPRPHGFTPAERPAGWRAPIYPGRAEQKRTGHTPSYPARAEQKRTGHTPSYPGRAEQKRARHTPSYPGRAEQKRAGHTPSYPARAEQKRTGHTPSYPARGRQQGVGGGPRRLSRGPHQSASRTPRAKGRR